MTLEQLGFDLESLLDMMPFYVMLLDADHTILFANKTLKKQVGPDPEKILGGYCPKVIHGTDAPYPGCPLEEALEKGRSVEREFYDPQTKRWVNSAVYPTRQKTENGKEIFLHFITDITARKTAENEVVKNYEIQTVLNTIPRLSLDDNPLDVLLNQVLDLILSIPGLAIEAKGGIFIVEDQPDVLVMKSQRGLPEVLQKECVQIPFGKCACGKAAASRRIEFLDPIDPGHEFTHAGMAPHGHYCVPIVFGDKTLGLINLYVPEGHVPHKGESEFLTAIANTLAGVIARKQIDDHLKQREKELVIKTGSLEEMNSALKVLLQRREDDRKELEEKVTRNVEELVIHYLARLKNTRLDNKQTGLIEILESNLNNIISPFSKTLSRQHLNITPMELEIADLIRQGKNTKEMAEILNISARTIEFHRQNIRKKLGINQKKANLRTLLMSLQ